MDQVSQTWWCSLLGHPLAQAGTEDHGCSSVGAGAAGLHGAGPFPGQGVFLAARRLRVYLKGWHVAEEQEYYRFEAECSYLQGGGDNVVVNLGYESPTRELWWSPGLRQGGCGSLPRVTLREPRGRN